MSQSLASAKRRRAPVQETPVNNIAPQNQSQPQIQSGGLTLPQVIQIVDKRLIVLEKFMTETKTVGPVENSDTAIEEGMPSSLSEVVEEFNQRYEMLAEEIVNIKNIVLSLQSYTMEVNKKLLEERIRILSDVEGVEPEEESLDENNENNENNI
jgi:hypothetical protein